MTASRAPAPDGDGGTTPEQREIRALKLRYRRLVQGIEHKLKGGFTPTVEELNFARSMIRCETKILRREPTLSSLDLVDRVFQMVVADQDAEAPDSRNALGGAIREHARCAKLLLGTES
jgi:hypothetical protein